MEPQLPTSGSAVETDAETEARPYCVWMEERLRLEKLIPLTEKEKKMYPCRPLKLGKNFYQCQAPTCKRYITDKFKPKGNRDGS